MFNRQRNSQRLVEKDQVKSGRTARKEDARTLFGDAQDSESDGKSSDKSHNDQAEVQNEESASEAAEIEAPQPSPTKSRCTTRSQNKSKPKVGKLAEAKKYILSQFDLLDEDSFQYMFVELQDAKVKLMVEYPFVKEVVVKRFWDLTTSSADRFELDFTVLLHRWSLAHRLSWRDIWEIS